MIAADGRDEEGDDDWQDRPTITVHDTSGAAEPTGLLDQFGAPLFRVRETVPMGFQAPTAPKRKQRTPPRYRPAV